MINPSTTGWVEKFIIESSFKKQSVFDEDQYYNQLRTTGFLFGNTLNTDSENELLIIEKSKVSYLQALYGIYHVTQKTNVNFVENCNLFFEKISPSRSNVLQKLLPKISSEVLLEKYITDRFSLNENLISKNLTHFSTNAFLFIDVLAFQKFLLEATLPDNYFKKIEQTIISVITLALKNKSEQSASDELMIKYFEGSIRYSKISEITISDINQLKLDVLSNNLEKKYCIDIACLTFWNDKKMENSEIYFLHKLAELLEVDQDFVYICIQETDELISKNILDIPFLNTNNSFKNYYSQTNQKVTTLLLRNKKRILKEIGESKELMQLLVASTSRDLQSHEKKKVKTQLLDICKTIPSLTIFLIPGGSLLLPLLIKFIPKLLPSSFNENLHDDN